MKTIKIALASFFVLVSILATSTAIPVLTKNAPIKLYGSPSLAKKIPSSDLSFGSISNQKEMNLDLFQFSSDPVTRWNRFLAGLGSFRGVTVDSSGNIYVVGGIRCSIAKLNSSGVLQWSTFLGEIGTIYGRGITVDTSGNIFVTGDCDSTWGTPVRPRTGGSDAFVAKLNNNGTLEWNTFLGGLGDDYGRALALDMGGNVYVTGDSNAIWGIPVRPRTGGSDAFAAKLNNNGVLEWNTFLGGSGDDYGRGIAGDSSGNLYVVGSSGAVWGTPGLPFTEGSNAFIANLNGNGVLQWNTFLGGLGLRSAEALIVNTNGIFIAGEGSRAFIAKLKTTGTIDWTYFYNEHGSESIASGITMDTNGNIYAAVTVFYTYPAAYAIKLDVNGAYKWSKQLASQVIYNNYSNSFSKSIPYPAGPPYPGVWFSNAITSFKSGCVYVAGAQGGENFITKISEPKINLISPNGSESWAFATTQDIKWSSEGDIPKVKIEYTKDGGSIWTDIAASAQNTGSFPWFVPNTPSDQCLVRVSDADFTNFTDKSEAVFSILASPYPYIVLNPASLKFGASGSQVTRSQSLFVSNVGGGVMNWNAAGNQSWISVLPASGTGRGEIQIGVNSNGLSSGIHRGKVYVTAAGVINSPQSIDVTLNMVPAEESSEPFGSFDTPIDRSKVTSSIPVTGWALDDVEVTGVKIYRDPASGESTQPNGLVYIGDAVFVEGARPDVEAIYSNFPLNSRAGWGYMLLTNFLPNNGNGTFTLHAIATDKEGHNVPLWTKTILCDNANAIKPFGAIDTPIQGGMAFGSAFVNFGWALTPLPKSIPIDGTTITVWVDGLPLGHPTYNNYRSDIAELFPGYLNSNGAVGYFFLNTADYENKVHTLSWSVTDSDFATDGIGSRYFQILNTESELLSGDGDATSITIPRIRREHKYLQSKGGNKSIDEIQNSKSDTTIPIFVRRGYDFNQPAKPIYPDREGITYVSISQIERVAVYLDPTQALETQKELLARGQSLLRRDGSSPSPQSDLLSKSFDAYLLIGTELRRLPIGTTFDSEKGVLYWQPGPGFLGEYQFVIVDKEKMIKKAIKITIVPARDPIQ